jgi:phosphate-selective porin OprO/OprP
MPFKSQYIILQFTSPFILFFSLLFYISPVNADEITIYKRLRDNGIITAVQFEALVKSVKKESFDKKTPTEKVLSKSKKHSKSEHATVNNKGKLSIKSPSGDFKYQIGGRIQADAANYSADNYEFTDGTEFRRARVFIKGKMYKNWLWQAQFDFSSNDTEIKDMYLGYKFDPAVLRIGQFGESGSLEDSTSSKYITFMERALPVLAFAPAKRRIGIGLNSYNDYGSYSIGIFGNSESADETESGKGASTRVSYVPWYGKTQTLHIGLSLQYRTPPDLASIGKSIKYRARPEAHVDDNRLLDTGSINDVSNYSINGLEVAWVNGPFSLQGEYIRSNVARADSSDLTFSGYYAYASWFMTGESRPYNIENGTFGRIKPRRSVGSAGIGAWEMALRFSELDLNDQLITGGKANNITLGLNWYPDNNIRFMFNYIRADTDKNAENIDLDIMQMRAQIDF